MESILTKLHCDISQVKLLISTLPSNILNKQPITLLDQILYMIRQYRDNYNKIQHDDSQNDLLTVVEFLNLQEDEICNTILKDQMDQFQINIEEQKEVKIVIPRGQRGFYKKYSEDFKKLALELLHQTNFNYKEVENEISVSKKYLNRWLKNGHIRKKGGGRKVIYHELEHKVYEWIQSRHSVSKSSIKEKAVEFSVNSAFKASRGWLRNFMERFKIKI